MQEQDILVKVSNVSKKIGKTSIINDVSFELCNGEILGLLGPNGSGKTTILKMLVGLLKPTKGSITIHEFDLQKDFERAISNVGAIIENPIMYDFLSGYENLVQLFRMTDQFSYERIDEMIELLRMDEYINDKVHTYSLGMRQRLGLAQALLHRPSILLLDEPTNGLDPEGMKSLRDTLRRLANKEGVSIIISSHILSEIELICDSVLVMNDGRCIERSQLRDWQNNQIEKQTFQFRILNVDSLKTYLIDEYRGKDIVFHSNGFSIEVELEEVARLNKLLVGRGFDVVGIARIDHPLEQIFLKKLGRGE
ncbi:ABC transporter ATP-binding protein [Metabacillus halosaccharovorans]|uniref:ABC transporter ATP-binding protein n=1 Tax=Metabacillus halosaccharovorans TaxID=930124 RepID=A0ABT3DPD5_9BACI|nr:ABC transporter ATP-binding protein [Metabacillus halosaccharovorans]MCV9888887.1 ABC transporter ATP-binding protein [Metabacillus halosaccharovorans]